MNPTAQYQQIFKYSSEGLIVCDEQGKIELANPRIIEMFGYSDEHELLGESIELLIPRNLSKRHEAHRKAYVKHPSTRSMGGNKKLKALRKDQIEFPVEVSLSYYHESDCLKVIAFVVDITQRVAMEEELNRINSQLEKEVDERTSELKDQYQLLQSVASNFPNGNIYAIDKEFNIVWSDGQLLRKRGLTNQHLKGVSFSERLPLTVREKLMPQLQLVFQGQSLDTELQIEGNYYSLQSVPLPDDRGIISRILLVEMDVTPNKLMALELARNLEKEKTLNEMKSRFVSMASHEFRTPLSSIVSSASLIGKYQQTEQQEKRDKHINRIKKSVANLTTILNDFLSVDKLESGALEVNIAPVNLDELMEECIDEVRVVRKQGQTFRYSNLQALNNVQTDRKLLKNITLNLLSNASKYSGEDQAVELTIQKLDSSWQLRVRDHGIGIPEEEQEQLFGRFFRAKNAVNIQGTGLGLSIVKKYTEILNGSVCFESHTHEQAGSEETGTLFIVELPLL